MSVYFLKKTKVSILVCLMQMIPLLSMCSGAFAQTSARRHTTAPDFSEIMARAVDKPLVTSELKKMVAVNRSQLVAKFKDFKPHANDASEIYPFPDDGINQGFTALSPSVQSVLQRALLSHGGQNAKMVEIQNTLLSKISIDQWWSVLEALENGKNYDAASKLAQALKERESDQNTKDLLILVHARNAWMTHGFGNKEYQESIEQAIASKDPDVAASAKLWKAALTQPQRADELLLSYQIWKSIWIDMGEHERCLALVNMITHTGPAVFDAESKIPRQPQERDRILGKVLSATSRAAFQANDYKTLKWATAVAGKLTQADADDMIFPQYMMSVYHYSHDDYKNAVRNFEKVFFSGLRTDVAADAGYLISECYEKMGDPVGAVAILELMNKLYSTRKHVMAYAYPKLEQLRKRLDVSDPKLIGQYIDKHFKAQYERALAEQAKNTPNRNLAGLVK